MGDLLTNIKRAGPGLGIVIIDMELQKPRSQIFGLHNKEFGHDNLGFEKESKE